MKLIPATILPFISLLTAVSSLYSVEPVPFKSILSSVVHDEELSAMRKSLQFMESSPGNTPVLNNLQYRHKIDDRGGYGGSAVRLYPNGFREGSHAGALSYLAGEKARIDYNILLSLKLKERYALLVQLMSGTSLLALYERQRAILTDKLQVLKRYIDLDVSQVNASLGAEMNLDQCRLDVAEQRNRVSQARRKIGSFRKTGGDLPVDLSGIITAREISLKLDALRDEILSINRNMIHQKSLNEFRTIREKYEYELARERRYLNYVELSMDRDTGKKKDGGKDTRTGLEFAFSLPFVTSGNLELNARHSAFIAKQGEVLELERKLKLDLQEKWDGIKIAQERYGIHRESGSMKRARRFLDVLGKSPGSDPLLILDINEHMVKHDIAAEKMKESIYLMYIDILDLSGLLSRTPVTNYLAGKDERL